MNRLDEIIKAHDESTVYNNLTEISAEQKLGYYIGFNEGAKWADEHPSDEVVYTVLDLYDNWRARGEWDKNLTVFEFVRKYWNNPENYRNKPKNYDESESKQS